jgi:amino-acid N-acetyltransferase
MIVPESQENIRPAASGDIPAMLQILEPLEQQGILVRRTSEELERDIARFVVAEAEGNIIGCASIYLFNDDKNRTAELAALAVSPFYRGGGLGERLLEHAEAKARSLGAKSLFVLSTRTTHWFLERGFREAGPAQLPQARRANYNEDRRSKVFIKDL